MVGIPGGGCSGDQYEGSAGSVASGLEREKVRFCKQGEYESKKMISQVYSGVLVYGKEGMCMEKGSVRDEKGS